MADRPVSQLRQMRHSRRRAAPVFDANRGKIAPHPFAGHDHGRAARSRQNLGRERPVEQNQTVGLPRGQVIAKKLIRIGAGLGVGDQHPVLRGRENRRQPGEDLGKERVGDVGQQHDDRAGALTAQVGGCRVDAVAGLGHGAQHRLPSRRRDNRGLGQGPAHGGGRYPRHPGNILNRGGFPVHSCLSCGVYHGLKEISCKRFHSLSR